MNSGTETANIFDLIQNSEFKDTPIEARLSELIRLIEDGDSDSLPTLTSEDLDNIMAVLDATQKFIAATNLTRSSSRTSQYKSDLFNQVNLLKEIENNWNEVKAALQTPNSPNVAVFVSVCKSYIKERMDALKPTSQPNTSEKNQQPDLYYQHYQTHKDLVELIDPSNQELLKPIQKDNVPSSPPGRKR